MRQTYQNPPALKSVQQSFILGVLVLTLFLLGSCEKDLKTVQFELTTTVSPAEGGTISITDGSFDYGKEISLTATPSQGYTFINWTGAVAGNENPIKVVFNANKNISANFEKLDADADGVPDDIDQCANTTAGQTVSAQGCSESQKDSDGDGVMDDKDNCDDTPTGTTVGEDGCEEVVDNDSDSDGVPNDLDTCANTPSGVTVDENGCSDAQNGTDSDSDGITDNLDECPETPTGETVDESGCSDSQKDTDADGISDDLDVCAETPSGESVDETGCSDSERDSDGDGVPDTLDQCPDTDEGETVNEEGCKQVARTSLPDDSFEQLLIDLGYDDVLDGFVNTENIITVASLTLNGVNGEVIDLTGLEDFVSLTSLSVNNMTTTLIDLGNHPLLVSFGVSFSQVELLLAESLENLEVIGNEGSRIMNATITDCPKLANMGMRDANYDNLIITDNPLIAILGGPDDNTFGDVRVENCSLFKAIYAYGVRSLEIINCESVTSLVTDAESFGGFRVGGITLTGNQNLTEIDVRNAGLNSLVINAGNGITSINLEGNLLTALDVSIMANLENLTVLEDNLGCIQVTQEQLDTVPATWSVGDTTEYSLDCGQQQ